MTVESNQSNAGLMTCRFLKRLTVNALEAIC